MSDIDDRTSTPPASEPARPRPGPTDLLSCPWYAAVVRAGTVLAEATDADGVRVRVRLYGPDVPVPREFGRAVGGDVGDGVCTCVESSSYRLEVVLIRRPGRDPFDPGIAALLEQLRPAVRRGLDDARDCKPARAEVQLSDTEQRIAQGLRQDLTERAIAENLGRSANTVHVHVKSIYRKLGVRTRQQLLDRLAQHPRLAEPRPDAHN